MSDEQTCPDTQPQQSIGAASSRHLPQFDFMRVVVFAFVISAHVVTWTLNEEEIQVAGWGMLMHFTRYAFVFISAFVLCYSYRNRELHPLRFWRRRFSTIVMPYLLWTLIYNAVGMITDGWPGLGSWLTQYAFRVLTGSEWYHLYFLLISIQFYIVFPLFCWLVKAAIRRPRLLLLTAAGIQLITMALSTAAPQASTPLGALWRHSDILLPMYALFVMAGGLGALHIEQLSRWVSAHRLAIVLLGCASLGFTLGLFILRTRRISPWSAALPEYPGVLPWAFSATLIIYMLATNWATRQSQDALSAQLLAAGAYRAFGVFAIHPLILWCLQQTLVPHLQRMMATGLASTALVYLLTIVGSLAAVELLLRTPVSKVLVARPQIKRHRTPLAA